MGFEEGVPILFSQGARFAVSREQLLQHPKSYYERLLQVIASEQDPWQSYYYEFLWSRIVAASSDKESLCGSSSYDPGALLDRDKAVLEIQGSTKKNNGSKETAWKQRESGRKQEDTERRQARNQKESGRKQKETDYKTSVQ